MPTWTIFGHPVVATLRDSSRAVLSSVLIPARSRRMILQPLCLHRAQGSFPIRAFDCICLAPPLMTSDADLDRIVDIVADTIPAVLATARDQMAAAR